MDHDHSFVGIAKVGEDRGKRCNVMPVLER